jgi:hypothetical protein
MPSDDKTPFSGIWFLERGGLLGVRSALYYFRGGRLNQSLTDTVRRWGSGSSSKRPPCPALSCHEILLEGAVRYRGSNLQHHNCSPRRPAHLLIPAHPAM